MSKLTREQSDILAQAENGTLVSAAAGSGKTGLLVARYVTLLESIRPRDILLVTFTEKASEELKLRIKHSLSSQSLQNAVEQSPFIGTIHSFCYHLLSARKVSPQALERVIHPLDFSSEFGEAFHTFLQTLDPNFIADLAFAFGRRNTTALFRSLYEAEVDRRPFIQPPETTPLLPLLVREAARFSMLFREHLRSKGLFTFNDLETEAEYLLQAEKSPYAFRYVLIDEFQDTSRLQWKILRHFCGPKLQKLFAVGDPKQSIYGFRHADIRLFTEVSEELVSYGRPRFYLSTNFRSAPDLIHAFNRFGEATFQSTLGFQPMETHRELNGSSPQLIPIDPSDPQTEERALVTHVRSLLDEGIRPGQVALLFRVSDRIPQVTEWLAKVQIPSQTRKTHALTSDYAVVDTLTFLQAVLKPESDYLISAFLRSEYVRYSLTDLWALHQKAKEAKQTLFDTLRANQQLRWFTDLVASGEQGVEHSLLQLYEHAGHNTSGGQAQLTLFEFLSKENLSLPEAARAMSHWKEDTLYVDPWEIPHSDEHVQLMTIHAAKGLEFERVCLVDIARTRPSQSPPILYDGEGRLGFRYQTADDTVTTPAYDTIKEQLKKREEEEEVRLFYVAITRARDSLMILVPQEGKKARHAWVGWCGKLMG